MTIFEKLAFHKKEKALCRIKRLIEDKPYKLTNGYVIDYSDDFVLVREVGDITLCGLCILPIRSIIKIRYNRYDKYMDYMLEAEGLKEQVKQTFKIDLNSWQTIFTSIQETGLNCKIENESDKHFFFKIGPIIKVKKKNVLINDFDPEGYLDEKPDKIRFKEITSVGFDDNYTNVFSKYLRKRD